MATASVTGAAKVAAIDDVGVYGLLTGFRQLHVDAAGSVARAFAYLDDADLKATANRADNVLSETVSVLRTMGDLIVSHDETSGEINTTDIGSAVMMLTDLLDGARLVEADARYELQQREKDRTEAAA